MLIVHWRTARAHGEMRFRTVAALVQMVESFRPDVAWSTHRDGNASSGRFSFGPVE